MTFKEFSQAIKKDARLCELLDRCDRSCEPLTDEELNELVNRSSAIMDEDYDDWRE
jgi:hypothetical protein